MEGTTLSITRDSLKDLLNGIPPAPEWLVPDLIPKGSMIALCGLPGVGKSVFGYALSLALGSGLPILNRRTKPSRVLYLDEENGHRDRRAYVYRAWVGLGKPDPAALDENVAIHGFALTTSATSWDGQLRVLAAEAKPDLIIVDTATPAFRIVDENSNGEAAIVARKLRGIMDSTSPDCSMLIMKHLRVDAEGRADMRGAKFWKGTVDGILFHKRMRGRAKADGTYKTKISPEKVRAFGLRTFIEISAEYTPCGQGFILQGVDRPLEDDPDQD